MHGDDRPTELLEDLTGPGTALGTVAYMSPEQITMDPGIDYRTDTYSLGAILYEILSGHMPSEGLTVDEIVHKTLKVEPPKPSTLTELEVPERLEQLCMRCLAKDPDGRPAHMRERTVWWITSRRDWI